MQEETRVNKLSRQLYTLFHDASTKPLLDNLDCQGASSSFSHDKRLVDVAGAILRRVANDGSGLGDVVETALQSLLRVIIRDAQSGKRDRVREGIGLFGFITFVGAAASPTSVTKAAADGIRLDLLPPLWPRTGHGARFDFSGIVGNHNWAGVNFRAPPLELRGAKLPSFASLAAAILAAPAAEPARFSQRDHLVRLMLDLPVSPTAAAGARAPLGVHRIGSAMRVAAARKEIQGALDGGALPASQEGAMAAIEREAASFRRLCYKDMATVESEIVSPADFDDADRWVAERVWRIRSLSALALSFAIANCDEWVRAFILAFSAAVAAPPVRAKPDAISSVDVEVDYRGVAFDMRVLSAKDEDARVRQLAPAVQLAHALSLQALLPYIQAERNSEAVERALQATEMRSRWEAVAGTRARAAFAKPEELVDRVDRILRESLPVCNAGEAFDLGESFRTGRIVTKDEDLALTAYLTAARLGNVSGFASAAALLLNGIARPDAAAVEPAPTGLQVGVSIPGRIGPDIEAKDTSARADARRPAGRSPSDVRDAVSKPPSPNAARARVGQVDGTAASVAEILARFQGHVPEMAAAIVDLGLEQGRLSLLRARAKIDARECFAIPMPAESKSSIFFAAREPDLANLHHLRALSLVRRVGVFLPCNCRICIVVQGSTIASQPPGGRVIGPASPQVEGTFGADPVTSMFPCLYQVRAAQDLIRSVMYGNAAALATLAMLFLEPLDSQHPDDSEAADRSEDFGLVGLRERLSLALASVEYALARLRDQAGSRSFLYLREVLQYRLAILRSPHTVSRAGSSAEAADTAVAIDSIQADRLWEETGPLEFNLRVWTRDDGRWKTVSVQSPREPNGTPSSPNSKQQPQHSHLQTVDIDLALLRVFLITVGVGDSHLAKLPVPDLAGEVEPSGRGTGSSGSPAASEERLSLAALREFIARAERGDAPDYAVAAVAVAATVRAACVAAHDLASGRPFRRVMLDDKGLEGLVRSAGLVAQQQKSSEPPAALSADTRLDAALRRVAVPPVVQALRSRPSNAAAEQQGPAAAASSGAGLASDGARGCRNTHLLAEAVASLVAPVVVLAAWVLASYSELNPAETPGSDRQGVAPIMSSSCCSQSRLVDEASERVGFVAHNLFPG